MNNLSRTKKITLSALLIGISIVYTSLMPTLELGIWSFTPFSHLFIILGTLISPFIGCMTTIGTLIGFALKGSQPILLLRAASHIFFVVFMIIMIKYIKINKPSKVVLLGGTTALVHGVFEICAVLLGIAIALPVNNTSTFYILVVTGGATVLHSIVDFIAAYFIYIYLKKILTLESNVF